MKELTSNQIYVKKTLLINQLRWINCRKSLSWKCKHHKFLHQLHKRIFNLEKVYQNKCNQDYQVQKIINCISKDLIYSKNI
jgi:hypothetical protein